jgi:hypothetical protein
MSNHDHHKIAPNTVVYHLSIHHWQRDMIFLVNTYALIHSLSQPNYRFMMFHDILIYRPHFQEFLQNSSWSV